MHASPLDPIDFEVRPGVPHSGWPISYHDMAEHFPRTHDPSDVGPYTYDASGRVARARPADGARPLR